VFIFTLLCFAQAQKASYSLVIHLVNREILVKRAAHSLGFLATQVAAPLLQPA
jgi:hypothetical protein